MLAQMQDNLEIKRDIDDQWLQQYGYNDDEHVQDLNANKVFLTPIYLNLIILQVKLV